MHAPSLSALRDGSARPRMLAQILLCVVSLASFAQDTNDSGDMPARFTEGPCPFPIPEELLTIGPVISGYSTVPSSHFDSAIPGTMRLPVVKLPATGPTPRDPIVLLAGGPGESTLASYIPGMARPLAQGVRRNHDVILIELRGLRFAEPSLDCPEVAEARLRWLAEALPYDDTALQMQLDAFAVAYKRLTAEGIDLNLFNLQEMTEDVVGTVTALGYETFNLYGNSAGTILVQHIMRDHPERLRAVVMGSSIPPTVNPRTANPAVAERAFALLFESVRANPAASGAFPELEEKFFELVSRLNEDPHQSEIRDPLSGQAISLAFTGDRLIELVYTMLLLDANGAAPVPMLIQSLYENDFSLLGNFGALLMPPQDFSWGVQLSAMLREYRPSTEESIESAGLYPDVYRVMAYWRFGPIPMEAARGVWKVQAPGSDTAPLVTAEVPTLLLSGELDPATPPKYASTIAEALPNALQIVLPGVGHGPLDSGPCSYKLANSFIDEPASELDTVCAESMRARFLVEPLARRLLLPAPPVGPSLAIVGCTIILIITLPVYALRAWFRSPAQTAAQRQLARLHTYILVAAVLNVTLVATFIFAALDADSPLELLYGFPNYVRLVQFLPIVSVIPMIAVLLSIRAVWRQPTTGLAARLYITLLAIMLPVFLYLLHWWRLLPLT